MGYTNLTTNMEYQSLNELVDMIEEPNRSICLRMLDDHKDRFAIARGSSHNHQAWEGGYLDHITEVMNIARILYEPLDNVRPLPFTFSDSLLVLFLHDLEKPWKYEKTQDGWVTNENLKDKENQVWPFVQGMIAAYKFEMTKDDWNGVRYVEGEKDDYSFTKRTQYPLAAFGHMCDNWSARGWHDYPKEDDSWSDPSRNLYELELD